MKKQIISALVLAGMIIGASDALASRARQNVMGNGTAGGFSTAGSMYYDTMYNIFYNPAYVNDFKNWAIIEKGANAGTDEGGFVASMMNFNVGLFFNRTDAFTAPSIAQGSNADVGGFAEATRPIDFVIGGDSGVKWGLGLTYASEKGSGVGANDTQNNLSARAGVSVNNFEPFVDYRIMGKNETVNVNPQTEIKEKDMTFGLRYRYGEWTPYAAYRMGKFEDTANTGTTPVLESKNSAMIVGVGRDTKLGEGARLVYGVAYERQKLSDNFVSAGNPLVSRRLTVMPVNMALEGDVASWLTLRAGLRYDLMNKLSGHADNGAVANAGTQNGTITGRVGATIHANKFDIDWAFGQDSVGDNGAATANIDGDTFGFDGGTFANVSLSYKW